MLKSKTTSKKLFFSKKIISPDSNQEKIFLSSSNIIKSYWHDVDLYNKPSNKYNMIVEIPYQERIIREMNKFELNTPIIRKNNKTNPSQQVNLRDFSLDPIINYGFFPKTFSSNSKVYFNNMKGDNDPLDVIDIGCSSKSPGDLTEVNILGSFCLVDEGETDLKVIVSGKSSSISEDDTQKIEYTMKWFKNFKTFYGKPANSILENRLFSKEDTENMVNDFHLDYMNSKYYKEYKEYKELPLKDMTVNYFFTRKCNYECKFCFHTKKSSFILPYERQLEVLRLCKEAGALKVNFAGGEPFLYPEVLGEMVKASKEMNYDSVSIISNGKLITEGWISKYGEYLDYLGISCDSIDPEINFKHGRKVAGSIKLSNEKEKIIKISSWCRERKIKFKINTVVTSLNKQEDMSDFINLIQPSR